MHSGDSACAIPPYSLSAEHGRGASRTTPGASPRRSTCAGLINVQYAVKRPATTRRHPGLRDRGQPPGQPHRAVRGQGHRRAAGQGGRPGDAAARRWPSCATRGCCARRSSGGHVAVKEAVLPFNRFPDVDRVLGPEMRSTGEVMGIDRTVRPGVRQEPDRGRRPPARRAGTVFLSLADRDKARRRRAPPARFVDARLLASSPPHGTADVPRGRRGRRSTTRGGEAGRRPAGRRPVDAVDLIAAGQIQLVVNSPRGRGPRADGAHIRTAAGVAHIPCLTTAAAALAAAHGHRRLGHATSCGCEPLQECHPAVAEQSSRRAASSTRRMARSMGAARPAPVDLSTTRRVGGAAQPGHDGVGHRRARRRAGGATSTCPRSARWW